MELNGTSYHVKCRIGKYGLSAHADASEMNRFVQTLQPTYTLLVHGDDLAREQLSNVLDPKFHPMLVENGETYPFDKRSTGKGVVGKRYQQQVDATLQEKIGSLLLYQKDSEEAYKLAICTNVHGKTNTLVCQTLTGKQVKLSLEQVKETIGHWNRSMDELQEIANEVLNYSRPYLEKIDWSLLADGKYLLKDIFQAVKVDSINSQIAIALAVQSFPSTYTELNNSGSHTYTFDQTIKERLTNLDLAVQGIRLNPAHAMDKVRMHLADHPRFIRCGVDHLGTENETLTMYFDFPDAILEKERQELATVIKNQTGWAVNFSDSVRQDLLQTALTKLMGHPIQIPSIHLHERKVVVAMEGTGREQAVVDQFKKVTGFDLQWKGENVATAQALEEQALFQSKTASKRMENNQAIEEAKRWATERKLTIYKTSMKQQGSMMVMEVHFISPEIAKQHDMELSELSYRIGMPVTYAKSPKQNEIIRFTLEALPASWHVKKNPSVHMDKAMVALKLDTMPAEDEINIVRGKINQVTGYVLEVTA